MASASEVVLGATSTQQAHTLAQKAIDEVRRIETKYSRYRPDSVVSRINAAAGTGWNECDEETLSLLAFADTLYRNSGGLFDITSGLLRRAWDFKQGLVPTPEALQELCGLIGWQHLERDGTRVRLTREGMEIDFGGFGKEYAADRAAALLMQSGVHCGYVNLAGDMRVMGPKPDGAPWLIGIQDPRRRSGIIATIPLDDGALATSGDYERYFEHDGQRYCHILDPRTGQPVTYWRSVSVIAPLAVVAGGCATAAMLLQSDGGAFLTESGYAFLAINQRSEIFQHAGVQPGTP